MYCTFSSHTFPFVTQWNERIGAVILFLKVCIIIENITINKEKKNKNMGRVTERALLKIYKYKVYVVKKKEV
jgi:putative Mn2+ efflux pump MntP